MCGIAGYIGDFIPGLMARMNAIQAHRGPDGSGIFEDPITGVALGHTRLAILDLTDAAAQPMYSPDGRFVLVYNGEIYNFLDLRQNLIARGYNFKSTGDTEVLLYGLMEYGEDFLNHLNGIFAFALWDNYERELLLVRDQIGVKPLYYSVPKPGTLIFASEIKALCAHPNLKREPDFEALQQHLAYCHASGVRTALKGIYRLAPGHFLRWKTRTGQYKIQQYWKPPFSFYEGFDREEAISELRELINNASVRQLISDVTVGSLLSGGIDSSFITIFASPKANQGFECYTITYPASENRLDKLEDDTPYARMLARNLALSLKEIEISADTTKLWQRLIYHLDEPIADPAAIASYLISRLAKDNGTTVLLSGQGGDELFCGYPRYLVMHHMRWIQRTPNLLRHLITLSALLLPGTMEGGFGAQLRRIKRVLSVLSLTPDEQFLSLCAYSPQEAISQILSPDFKAELSGRTFMADCLEHMERTKLRGLQRFQERDLSIYLPNHNLLYTDKMGMAAGVEVRVPLLDLELVKKVLTYPYEWLLGFGKTKVLLREAARGILPEEIISRRKGGFGAPIRKWLRYDLKEMWDEITSEASVKKRGWFDYNALKRIRERSQEGKEDLYMLQWAVLTIELWARQFIDRNPVEGIRPSFNN